MSELYHDDQPPMSKVCKKCHVEKPLNQFEKGCAKCKVCRNKQRKQSAMQRRLSPDYLPPTHKICHKCKIEKAVGEFYKKVATSDGYTALCKECDDARKKRWDENHSEHIQSQKHQRYLNNIEEVRAYNQHYHQENRERQLEYFHAYYEAKRDIRRARGKAWQQANLLACREGNNRRRARKKGAKVSKIDYACILERDGFHCYICEKDIAPEQLSFDHVIPLERGGEHSIDNIKAAHKICNARKHTRLLEEMTPFQRRGI